MGGVRLKTAYHRDCNDRWTANDIHDIDALGSTIPHCDIVVTDKAAAAAVRNSGLAARTKSNVLHGLADLVDHFA